MPHPTRATPAGASSRAETPDLALLAALLVKTDTCAPTAARDMLATAGARFTRNGDTYQVTCAGIDGTGTGVSAAVSDWRRRASIHIAMMRYAAREAAAMRTSTGADRIDAARNVLRYSQDQRDPRPRHSSSWPARPASAPSLLPTAEAGRA